MIVLQFFEINFFCYLVNMELYISHVHMRGLIKYCRNSSVIDARNNPYWH